jgi:hypothetical protein
VQGVSCGWSGLREGTFQHAAGGGIGEEKGHELASM